MIAPEGAVLATTSGGETVILVGADFESFTYEAEGSLFETEVSVAFSVDNKLYLLAQAVFDGYINSLNNESISFDSEKYQGLMQLVDGVIPLFQVNLGDVEDTQFLSFRQFDVVKWLIDGSYYESNFLDLMNVYYGPGFDFYHVDGNFVCVNSFIRSDSNSNVIITDANRHGLLCDYAIDSEVVASSVVAIPVPLEDDEVTPLLRLNAYMAVWFHYLESSLFPWMDND